MIPPNSFMNFCFDSENSNSSANNSPSTNRRRGTSNRIQSPRVSRLGRASSSSPESMTSSYHGNTSTSMNNDANSLIQMSASLIENVNIERNSIMVQSLDPTILSPPSSKILSESNSVRSVLPQLNGMNIFLHSRLRFNGITSLSLQSNFVRSSNSTRQPISGSIENGPSARNIDES